MHTPDNMGRPVRADKTEVEDNGFRTCPECEGEFETDLDEIIDCDDHLKQDLALYKKILGLKELRLRELEQRVFQQDQLIKKLEEVEKGKEALLQEAFEELRRL